MLYWQSEQTAKGNEWINLNGQELANVIGNVSGYHLVVYITCPCGANLMAHLLQLNCSKSRHLPELPSSG
jgi:hypothetical protein